MDIVQGYRFFFGRDPESPEAVAAKRGGSRRDLLEQLAGSGEYEEQLAQPVIAGFQPSGGYFSDAPPRSTLAWAAGFLPLEDEARTRLSRAPNWVFAHATVLGDRRMRAAVPELGERLALDKLTTRLAALTADLGSRFITGEVEEVTDLIIRGYAIDQNAPGEVLGVELWIDDCFVAATRAHDYARELQERFGASGQHGFTFEGFTPVQPDDERPLRVEVRESGSKLLLGKRRLLWRPARDAHQLAVLTEELRQAKRTLAAIEQTLRLVSGAMGHSVALWDDYWRAYYVRTPEQTLREANEADGFRWRPRFDVLVTGAPHDPLGLEATLASVKAQTYADFHVHVLPPGPTGEAPDLNGDVVVLVDVGDTLAVDALHRIAAAAQQEPRPTLYSIDSDCFDGCEHSRPILRPSFDYDLLLQSPALGPTAAVEREALLTALAAGGGLDPAHRADLWLRVVETTGPDRVAHIPRVLHHLGPAALGDDQEAYARSVSDHLARRQAEATVVEADDPPGTVLMAPPSLRVVWPLSTDTRVAVIVPTRDRLDLLGPCLASLEATRGANRVAMEIVVVDNNSDQAATRRTLDALELSGRVRVLGFSDAFNWSAINNFAARNVQADVLVFLNNDTVALTPGWCDALCAQALRPDVGAVGARLLYEDGSIQHAGIVLGTAQALAAHEGTGAPAADPGYLGRRMRVHRTAAVTGACLATRREVFDRLGGFDEAQLTTEANDIDYCLRLRHAGLAIVYEPYATLYHFESRSRGHTGFDAEKRKKADAELAVLKRRWGDAASHDPYYNGHFDRLSRPFQRLGPPPDCRAPRLWAQRNDG